MNSLAAKKGWLDIDDFGFPTLEPGKELNIIMDNCSGQNKNNFVLRLAPLLVKEVFFKQVNFLFYIAGHTKNCCDRWFSIMKRMYRKKYQDL